MTQSSNVIAFPPRPANQPFRRPAALIRAAREGQRAWRRERDLARLLRAEEEIQNDFRLNRLADYDMKRHVLLMIAIMGEMRAALEAHPAPLATAL